MDNKYFATLDTEQIGGALEERIENYYQYVRSSGLLDLWQNSYDTYFQSSFSDGKLYNTGDSGEFVNLGTNHFRNILKHIKSLTVQQRPSFDCRAANNDYKSQAQCLLSNNLLEYYLRDKGLEDAIKDAVEFALLLGEGYLHATWEVNAGEVFSVNPDTNAPIREGDIKYESLQPLDVIRDPLKSTFNQNNWVIVRSKVNKWDLIAEHPELEDKILSIDSAFDKDSHDRHLIHSRNVQDDDVYLFTFYHKPTPAVEDGRMIQFLSSDCILIDTPLPYRELPVYPLMPAKRIELNFGYTAAFDLLPIQQMLNALYSTIATNQTAFGVQSLLLPRNSDVQVEDIGKGMRAIYYNAGEAPPSALQLTATPAEVFNFLRMLVQDLETLSGVNSVARGNPEASLKSGAALALVHSQALQFSQDLQHAYIRLLEQVGTHTINVLRDFAEVPRVAMISGKSNQSLMKEFKGDDLAQINRVLVDVGNPLSRTIAGRTQLAEVYLQNGMIETPDQYISVINTGRLEPLTEGKMQEHLNIKFENEQLTSGESEVLAVFTDAHQKHIQEHKAVLANPEARRDPQLVQRVLSHIQEHIMLLKTTDPNILMLMGQQPLQPQPQALPQGDVPQMMDPTVPLEQAADQVNMPNMPTNPLTGEQAPNPEDEI